MKAQKMKTLGFHQEVDICAQMLIFRSHSLRPYGLQPIRLLCPWNSSGKNTGVGCISFSRGPSWPRDQTQVSYIFCIGREILYLLSHQGSLVVTIISIERTKKSKTRKAYNWKTLKIWNLKQNVQKLHATTFQQTRQF